MQRQCQRQLLGASAKEYIPAGLSHGWSSPMRGSGGSASSGAERPHSGGDGETQGPSGRPWPSTSRDAGVGSLGSQTQALKLLYVLSKPWGPAPLPWDLWAPWSRTSLDEGRQTCSGPGGHTDRVFRGTTCERDLAQEQQGSVRPQAIGDDWLPALEPERRAGQ